MLRSQHLHALRSLCNNP